MNLVWEDISTTTSSVPIRVMLAREKVPWFYEIADALVDALCARGERAALVVDDVLSLEARWRDSRFSLGRWVVFTPELFRSMPCTGAMAFNMEQLDARGSHIEALPALNNLAEVCRGADGIWDYSLRNASFWASHKLNFAHVPLGYMPRMQYPPGLPGDADKCMFLGNVYGRRKQLVDELRHILGSRFAVVGDAFCHGDARQVGHRPMSNYKLAALGKARVVVNIKPVEPMRTCLETPRLWWCAANRIPVVSELDGDAEARRPFEEAGAAVFVPAEKLIDEVLRLMNEPVELLFARATAALAHLRAHHSFCGKLDGGLSLFV